MYKTRFKDNIQDPKAGSDYRRDILECGGTKDAIDMVYSFLGHEPNNEAFLKYIGLDNS
jgi:Zn-dependent oligopeptidase